MEANPWDSAVVTRLGEGRYSATISPSWNLAVAAQGGVVAAIAARAMEAELGTGQSLRSFHGVWGDARHLELGVAESGALPPEGGERGESGIGANCANARLHLLSPR
jgi:hypothetical protein